MITLSNYISACNDIKTTGEEHDKRQRRSYGLVRRIIRNKKEGTETRSSLRKIPAVCKKHGITYKVDSYDATSILHAPTAGRECSIPTIVTGARPTVASQYGWQKARIQTLQMRCRGLEMNRRPNHLARMKRNGLQKRMRVLQKEEKRAMPFEKRTRGQKNDYQIN